MTLIIRRDYTILYKFTVGNRVEEIPEGDSSKSRFQVLGSKVDINYLRVFLVKHTV
jgi:hypothetical protein